MSADIPDMVIQCRLDKLTMADLVRIRDWFDERCDSTTASKKTFSVTVDFANKSGPDLDFTRHADRMRIHIRDTTALFERISILDEETR